MEDLALRIEKKKNPFPERAHRQRLDRVFKTGDEIFGVLFAIIQGIL